ncbi:ScbR family autoregulator-binding transcription factor [Streptomyces sp. Ru71]|uniref:ScbR family autoregulator-binding transcription factor n=1 Tax=Streptomyces sp. Ru71 TaxID=2080746 RepID=UPI001C667098|nr:ScbR family autoregulator-binding transcription factor [Streptomyces sp. Ru71]
MQDRAIRTRRVILEAAAAVFEKRGFEAATISEIFTVAGVTKGALYFHFQSKEDLALGVLSEQDYNLQLPPRACKTQELVDVATLHAYRIMTDPLVSAAVRLSMDRQAQELDGGGPFSRWGEFVGELLEEARLQGELLVHVQPQETADVLVGAFSGVQSMSQVVGYRDLTQKVTSLLRHVIPSIVVPSVLLTLDMGADRGPGLYAEALGTSDAGSE